MAFSMFSAQISPIAINFGSTSAKLLQVSFDERPQIVAAAEIVLPEEIRGDHERSLAHYEQQLPKVLKECRFRGKKVVTAVPTSQTLVQHMHLAQPSDGVDIDDLVKAQLQMQIGIAPASVVVRSVAVPGATSVPSGKSEHIAFAVSRDIVMRYIGMMNKRKLEVTGMRTEALAMVNSFDHLSRREEDAAITTLFIDFGWSGVRAAMAHGKETVFARFFPMGGRAFDQHIASALHCDLAAAHAHRMELVTDLKARQTPAAVSGPGAAILNRALAESGSDQETPVASTATDERRGSQVPGELAHGLTPQQAGSDLVDFEEPLNILTDELRMCVRYARAMFPERGIDRVIFVGGESRQLWACQHVLGELGLRGQFGDPLSRFAKHHDTRLHNIDLDRAQPGWAVACGLCVAPTDS